MPRQIPVRLTAAQWAEIGRAQRAKAIEHRLWSRLEMVRHAALRRSIPAAAAGLGVHPQTARRHVKAFLAGGVAALSDEPRSDRQPKLTGAVLTAVRRCDG